MTPDELAAICTRAAAATRGPWAHEWVQPTISSRKGLIAIVVTFLRYPASVATAQDNDNAACITHARTDVPALLDEVDRLGCQILVVHRVARLAPMVEGYGWGCCRRSNPRTVQP
jgi:hypothetical protein